MDNIRQQLLELADEKYRRFSSSLVPGGEEMLGVRLPALRKLAKAVAKEDWRGYLSRAKSRYFEEVMLQGMVIGCAKAELGERLEYVKRFVPKIKNWSVCDSFCIGLKAAKEYPEEVWEFLRPYFRSAEEFEIRFAIVMGLDFFIDRAYIDPLLELISQARLEAYYARMAAAWALSMCFLKFPEKTMALLEQGRLDNFTYQKTLSKIAESLQVDAETRQRIRQMRRKD